METPARLGDACPIMSNAAIPNPALGPLSDLARPAPASAAPGRILITPDTESHLRADLDRLRHELEVVFAARIREARSTGDGSSGDDHLQIREEEMVVRAEVARVEALLASAVVVEQEDSIDGTAAIGSVVEVRDLDADTTYRHLITGDFDRRGSAEDVHPVSASSPVGQALLGLAPGSQALVELPSGRQRRLEVVGVTPAVSAEPATARPGRA
jgi:transcription elongation GreA/GreB family factor